MLMFSRWPAAFAALLATAFCLFAEEGGSPIPGVTSLAVGYDEGLVARAYLLNNISAYVGLSYYVKGADTAGYDPLNTFGFKLGGEYVLRNWESFRIAGFLEARGEMIQKYTQDSVLVSQGDGTMKHLRYNQWNAIFRLGIRPELFINKHFSIDYKLGFQLVCHGPDYKVNAAKSGTERRKNGYAEFGVYEARFPAVQDHVAAFINQSILLNIGLNFYIF